MELENWTHPATHIKITEGEEESLHPIQAYTDGSKSDLGVGAGVVIFLGNEIIKTMQYRLNERCTNNQAEQMAILKALEYTQNIKKKKKK
jgi:ribonuclease HI